MNDKSSPNNQTGSQPNGQPVSSTYNYYDASNAQQQLNGTGQSADPTAQLVDPSLMGVQTQIRQPQSKNAVVSVRNLLIGGLITFALVLAVFAAIVLPPLMRPSAESYASAARKADILENLAGTSKYFVIKKITDWSIGAKDMNKTRDDLAEWRSSLSAAIIDLQSERAVKVDKRAGASMSTTLDKYHALEHDLNTMTNVLDALLPILPNLEEFNGAMGKPALNDKELRAITADADTISTTLSSFNTSNHDIDLNFNELGKVYKNVVSARKPKADGQLLENAKGDFNKFVGQWSAFSRGIVDKRTDLVRSIHTLRTYLEEKSNH